MRGRDRFLRASGQSCSLSKAGIQDRPVEYCFNQVEQFICWPPEGQRICHDTEASVIWNPQIIPPLSNVQQGAEVESFLQLYTKYSDPTSGENITILQFNVRLSTGETPMEVTPYDTDSYESVMRVYGLQFLPIKSALGPSKSLQPGDAPLEITMLFYDYQNPVTSPYLEACAPTAYPIGRPCSSGIPNSSIVSRTHTGPTITVMPPMAQTVSWQPSSISSPVLTPSSSYSVPASCSSPNSCYGWTYPTPTTSCPPLYVCDAGGMSYIGPNYSEPSGFDNDPVHDILVIALPITIVVIIVLLGCCFWGRKRKANKSRRAKEQEERREIDPNRLNYQNAEPRISVSTENQHDIEDLPSYDEARHGLRDMSPAARPPDYESRSVWSEGG